MVEDRIAASGVLQRRHSAFSFCKVVRTATAALLSADKPPKRYWTLPIPQYGSSVSSPNCQVATQLVQISAKGPTLQPCSWDIFGPWYSFFDTFFLGLLSKNALREAKSRGKIIRGKQKR